MDMLKITKFPFQKRFHNKQHINLPTEFLKGSSTGVSNIFSATHGKSNKNGKIRSSTQTVDRDHSVFIFFKWLPKLWLSTQAFCGKHNVRIFFKVFPKAMVVK